MKRVLEIVDFLFACVNAIVKGFKTVGDHWPTDNPFLPDGEKQNSNNV